MKVMTELKDLNAAISMIKEQTGTTRALIQECAVGCIVHALEKGNCTPAANLCNALEDGWRSNALKAWFLALSPFKYNSTEKVFYFGRKEKEAHAAEYANDKDTYVEERLGSKWWEFKPEAEFKGFDLDKELKRILAKAEKVKGDLEKAEHKKTKISADRLEKLRLIVQDAA